MSFSEDDRLRKVKERFLAKTESNPRGYNECLMWIGSKTGSGYGQMQFGARREMAHRISYQLFRGAIPAGMTIDHYCKNKLCVNPLHLEPMPMLDNCRLGSPAQNTHCPKGHPFEGENVIWIKDSKARMSRMCRICKQDKDRKYHWKNRERINAGKREAWRKACGK